MRSLLKMMPVILAVVCGSITAKADVVVGAHADRYGTLLVLGNPNKDVQDLNYTVDLQTVGSHSEDTGQAPGVINQKLKLRAGQYSITYAGVCSGVEIKEGQLTTVQLQKVTASPLPSTSSVALLVRRTPDENDDTRFSTLATWQRTGYSQPPIGQQCHTYNSGGWGGLFGGGEQSCYPAYRSTPITYSWKSAYFYVLPGTYSMQWSFEDGTTHQEDDIEVK